MMDAKAGITLLEKECLTTFLNNQKKVENTTRSGVSSTNFDVFGKVDQPYSS